jgi:hypothetical protein
MHHVPALLHSKHQAFVQPSLHVSTSLMRPKKQQKIIHFKFIPLKLYIYILYIFIMFMIHDIFSHALLDNTE